MDMAGNVCQCHIMSTHSHPISPISPLSTSWSPTITTNGDAAKPPQGIKSAVAAGLEQKGSSSRRGLRHVG